MFADGIAFMCFYDGGNVLSAIDSYVSCLGCWGRGWNEGREEERKEEAMEARKMRLHDKIAPKYNIFGTWRRPSGARVIHFWKLFSRAIFSSQIVSWTVQSNVALVDRCSSTKLADMMSAPLTPPPLPPHGHIWDVMLVRRKGNIEKTVFVLQYCVLL